MSLVSLDLMILTGTLTPGDLENEVMTPKSSYSLDIALKTPIHKFIEPRLNDFLGILSASSNFKDIDPG